MCKLSDVFVCVRKFIVVTTIFYQYFLYVYLYIWQLIQERDNKDY